MGMRGLTICAWMLLLGPMLPGTARGEEPPKAGATQNTPSRAQYFSWINNTNEGATEQQTRANLAFFRWLHDEYGMTLDIYAFDAGFVDGKGFCAILDTSDRFKRQFPHGLVGVVRAAAAMGTRLGHWGGPDGFGNTPEDERRRIDMMTALCREYHWALFKFDAVCGDLRPEKESAFIRMMKECRAHSPDLVALNHRLPLGAEGLALMTTNLWDGQETYIDANLGNCATAPHHRQGSMRRGHTPNFDRLMEDHGVCISSCPDHFDDDMILQTFSRNLILAPEVYGNPWLLRDDEFPKFARIFNLARRYRQILVNALTLPENGYGANAVSRGDSATRLITLRNLTWEPVNYTLMSSEDIGLAKAEKVEWRQFHPTERALGSLKFGTPMKVTVPPFRACLLMATARPCGEVGVTGCDYEVERDTAGRPVVIRLMGLPGTSASVSLLSGERRFISAELDGQEAAALVKGESVRVVFAGTPLSAPWHRKLGELKPCPLPTDAESLYEATCFAADNNSLEIRSLARSGATAIPAVQAARDAFFHQPVFVGRGTWDRYMFDGNPATSFYMSRRRRGDPRVTQDALLRLDFGEIIKLDAIELTVPDQFSLADLLEGEGGSVAQFSADLKTWTMVPFVHGEVSRVPVPAGTGVRYARITNFATRVSEINAYAGSLPLPREKWRASDLFGSFAKMKFTRAWGGTVRVDELLPGGYLCVAINGRHGVEGAYAAIRCGEGRWIGAPDRATSYPANVWESGVCQRDGNYTYYFPLTSEMVGRDLQVVVLGGTRVEESLRIDVWQTAHAAPFRVKRLVLRSS